MAELDGKKTAVNGLVGIILLLGGFGGGMFLDESEFNNAYVCPLNENVGMFHRLSASEKTGYYFDEADIEKSVACREGRTYAPWVSLRSYAEERGIDPLSFIINNVPEDIPDVPSPTEGKKWKCYLPPIGCVEING